jgi:methyl-accepting chemotaxis protein
MMQSVSCLGLALLQVDQGTIPHDVHLIMIFMMIIMIAVVIGFLGFSVAGAQALRLMRKGEDMAERLEGKVSPMADKTRALVEELGPKVTTITKNVEQITYTVRGKMDEFAATATDINRTVQDANKRTQAQVARVDGMVNEALNTAHNVSRTVQDGVRKPVQQIAGVVAALRKGIETLVERSPFKRHVQTDADEPSPYDTAQTASAPRYTATVTTVETESVGTKRMTPYG